LSFCARYLPATDLGGDFYDVIPISAAEAGVLLCDVMGHGVRAALVVAMIRALVEELQPRLADPAALLAGVNAGLLGLLRKTGRALFATAIYMVVDARHMQVRYAAAGHPEPFLVSAQTRRVTRLLPGPGGSGPALGLLADASFSNATTPLRNGDRLVLYTDGITEAANANGEEYGAERLCAALEHRAEWPCDRAFDDLLAEVRAFAAQEILADDVCLLCTELRHAIPA
jgi:sigma-B regulation protein RsbU (phosphoserine phosphatase)